MFNGLSQKLKKKSNSNLFYSKYADKLKKVIYFYKRKNYYLNRQLIDIIFLTFVFLLMPKKSFSAINTNCYIEIKVNTVGLNQIISDQYNTPLPSEYSYDNQPNQPLNDKYFDFPSSETKIKLFWSSLSFDNFSYMFSGLINITEVHISHMFTNKNNTLSYMFKDCINLAKFTSDIENDEYPMVKDTRGMFYNCSSLTSFQFTNLYFDYYEFEYEYDCLIFTCHDKDIYYNKINMSQMFYNCQKLEIIDTGLDSYGYISDMREMFYNCISLTSIDLSNFFTKDNYFIDLSYMFYNCKDLETITGNF